MYEMFFCLINDDVVQQGRGFAYVYWSAKMRKHTRKGRPLVVNLEKDSIASVNTDVLICCE